MSNKKRNRTKTRNPFAAFRDKWIILIWDKQVRLYFTVIAQADERNHRDHIMLFPSKKEAERITRSPKFRTHWMGYETEVHRYEALKEFGDHHRRQHWEFHALVQFFGTPEQMDWIAGITAIAHQVKDPRTGLILDWDNLPLPGLSKRLNPSA